MITDPAGLNETEPQTVGVGEPESSFKNLTENNVKSVIRDLSSNKAPDMGGKVRSGTGQFQYNQRPVTFSDVGPVSRPGNFSGLESCLMFAAFAPDSRRKCRSDMEAKLTGCDPGTVLLFNKF